MLPIGPVLSANMNHRAKFCADQSNRSGDITIFRFLKMAAVCQLGLLKVWNFTCWAGSEAQYASSCQMLCQSVKLSRRYGRFLIILRCWPSTIVVFITVQNLVGIGAVILIICHFLIFCALCLKMPTHAPKMGDLTPKRHILVRKHVIWRINCQNRSTGASRRTKHKINFKTRYTKKPNRWHVMCSPRPPTLLQRHMDLYVWSYPRHSYIFQISSKYVQGLWSSSGSKFFLLLWLLTSTTAGITVPAVMRSSDYLHYLRIQETQLSLRNCATCYISKFMLCFARYGSQKGFSQQKWPLRSFKGIGNGAIW